MSELTSYPAARDKAGMGIGGSKPLKRHWKWAVGAAAVLASAALAGALWHGEALPRVDDPVLVGEARRGGLTVELPDAVRDVRVREARVPGRPIVLIDPGHGGRDPGAPSVSGAFSEKQLSLAMASELADLLEKRGRVRVAMTREGDRYLTLEQRAAIARRLGASLFVSLHMDSAPNPLAQGVTLYSLSDVASSEEAARFAMAENRAGGALTSEDDGSLRSILSDLALRGQMEHSAALARRRSFDHTVTQLVREAQAEGLVRADLDAGVATRLIFGMINSVVEWYRPDGAVDPELLCDEILTVVLRGLQSRP